MEYLSEGKQIAVKENAEKRLPELSEEKAAQILKNVFSTCGVSENKVPFHELWIKYHKEGKEEDT